MKKIIRNKTRALKIGSISIGNYNPIAVQTMTTTNTKDVESTIEQIKTFESSGVGVVRIAIDSQRDVEALKKISNETSVNLAVDLQENYRLAELAAFYVDKIRYNPGHLWHYERGKSWEDKVKFIAGVAAENNCALRIGVNCGSVDPVFKEKYLPEDTISPMLECAFMHCSLLDKIGFREYCLSLKDSDPYKVIELNKKFSKQRPDVPLHLGVTEAGLPPDGVIKTRIALEQLISQGIGDTIRVSLTLPSFLKYQEIEIGKKILEDIVNGNVRSVVDYGIEGINLISCPSCSRVENEYFVELSRKVEEITKYANEYVKGYKITIATMGCRVNGPGETFRADLGLWCGVNYVNLMRKDKLIGTYSYDEILPNLKQELDKMIAEKSLE